MDIYELIRSRRTIRKFRQQPLTPEQLSRYVDAARMAPSGGNLQPLRYVCVHTPEMAGKVFPLVKWAGYLAPDYNPAEGERPTAYVVVCADTTVRPAGNETDTGAAVENLILAAWSEGVGSCWIGSVDRNAMSALLNLGPELKVMCVVALGYPAEIPRETGITNNSIKYFLDETGTLNVPKRSPEDILLGMM